MAQADGVRSKIVLLQDGAPLEKLSGWLIWELAIVVGFVILTLLTLYFILSNSGIFKRKPKKRSHRRKSRKKRFLPVRKARSKAKPKQRTLKSRGGTRRKAGTAIKKKAPVHNRKARRKKAGVSRQLKMPFLPDPQMIKSYTGKYLAREKIKANWEKVPLVGYDSEGISLNLEIYLLTKAFQWPPGKSDTIVYHKKTVNPSRYLKNKSLKQAFQKADSLISVGMVTELSDGDEREGLARRRAENMIKWLQVVLRRINVDYLLTLDLPKNEWGTIDEEVRKVDEQRPVLWICLKASPAEVNLEEALRDALSQAIQLPFDFDIYQEVTLESVAAG